MDNNAKIRNIITALEKHEDAESIRVLLEVGSNCPNDEIRELTAQALIRKNTHESLKDMILTKGKGINDLSARVSMSVINEILSLKDKTEVIRILEDTMNMHSDEEVRETARSVRALVSYS
ncbi:hypothetical protein J6Q66_06490 [bacterium]|nr:hypothetical protein [bacterium]